MRVNTTKSIKTANTVHARFGSWKAAKESASYEGGKFVVRSAADGRFIAAKTETTTKKV
jgi:hypothetical protein